MNNIVSDNEHFNLEFTDEELDKFKPIEDVMPQNLLNALLTHQADMENQGLMPRKLTRGKQKKPIKQVVTIRLSADVVEKFRAGGKGWQTRINEVLRQYVAQLK